MPFVVFTETLSLVDYARGLRFESLYTERFGQQYFRIWPIEKPGEFRFFGNSQDVSEQEWKDLKEKGINRCLKIVIILPDLQEFKVGELLFSRAEMHDTVLEGVNESAKGYGVQRSRPISVTAKIEYWTVAMFDEVMKHARIT